MEKTKAILIAVIIALISFAAGYFVGYGAAIKLCIDTGQKLLDIHLKPAAMNELLQRFPEIRGLLS